MANVFLAQISLLHFYLNTPISLWEQNLKILWYEVQNVSKKPVILFNNFCKCYVGKHYGTILIHIFVRVFFLFFFVFDRQLQISFNCVIWLCKSWDFLFQLESVSICFISSRNRSMKVRFIAYFVQILYIALLL